jgi:hypothetical protein
MNTPSKGRLTLPAVSAVGSNSHFFAPTDVTVAHLLSVNRAPCLPEQGWQKYPRWEVHAQSATAVPHSEHSGRTDGNGPGGTPGAS